MVFNILDEIDNNSSILNVYSSRTGNKIYVKNIMLDYLRIIEAGLNGNKLAEVWSIAHHFYLPSLKYVVNSTLDRMFLECVFQKLYYPY